MGEHYLVEAALENAEAIVDAATDDEILKNIPVVGTAIKLLKAAGDIRDRIFAAKLARFLQALDETTPEAREKIRQKIATSPDEAKEVGETLLLVLERITALGKAPILAYVFIAYTQGHIGPTDFLRLADAIDQAFIDDLFDLLHNVTGLTHVRYLSRTALTYPDVGKTYADAGELTYVVSPLGKQLIDAYSQGKQCCQGQ